MSGLPPNRSPEAIPTRIENHTASDGSPIEIIDYYQFVMGDYFGAMGVPIVAGRSFEPADAMSSGRVVIVNETLANRIWKGRNPIGQRVRPNLSAAIGVGDNSWHTVIGVAKDVKQGGVEKETGTELYVSLDQLAIELERDVLRQQIVDRPERRDVGGHALVDERRREAEDVALV